MERRARRVRRAVERDRAAPALLDERRWVELRAHPRRGGSAARGERDPHPRLRSGLGTGRPDRLRLHPRQPRPRGLQLSGTDPHPGVDGPQRQHLRPRRGRHGATADLPAQPGAGPGVHVRRPRHLHRREARRGLSPLRAPSREPRRWGLPPALRQPADSRLQRRHRGGAASGSELRVHRLGDRHPRRRGDARHREPLDRPRPRRPGSGQPRAHPRDDDRRARRARRPHRCLPFARGASHGAGPRVV